MLCQDHFNFSLLALTESSNWNLSLIARIDEFEIEALTQVSRDNFEIGNCEGVSKADSLSTWEGRPRRWVPFLSWFRQTEGTRGVEPFWYELMGPLPLLTIEVEAVQVYGKLVPLAHVHVADLCVLSEFIEACWGGRALISQCFTYNLAQVLEVRHLLESDSLLELLE